MKALLGSCLSCLLICITLGLPPLAAQTPPSSTPKPGEQSSLDKTPLPPDAIIVICENLKQAIGQMQPGSIILSPQRYQELIDELSRLRKEAQPPARERLFSACRLIGRVRRPPAGTATREYVELRVELDFRTDAAGARVPLALRGLPLTDAKLDGAMPTWAPLEEGLALLVAESKSHTLVLTTLAPLTGTVAERKLVLEQLPTAAITTLELTVPGRVLTATAKGQGPLIIEAAREGETRLSTDGLGIINQLELVWRLEAPKTNESPVLAATGEQRFFIDAAALEADARLRLELSKGRLDELEIRLPGEPQDLRAELLPSDERRAEPPELLSSGSTDRWRLRFKQPLTPSDGPATIRLRWTQSHSGRPGTRIPLSQVEILSPAKTWQAGTLTVVVAGDVAARVEAPEAVRAEMRDTASGEGRGLAQAFRYGARRMDLAVTITAPATAPAAEVRWNHELNMNSRRLRLVSELEVTRIAGANLDELEVKLPDGWRLDPSLLRNPFVRDVSAEGADGKVRIMLARQSPSPLKLRIESEFPAVGLNRAQFRLPRLVGGRAESNRQNPSIRWLHRPGRFTLSADDVTPRFEIGTLGLYDEEQRPPEMEALEALPRSWNIPNPALGEGEATESGPQVALYWQPRLPLGRLDARVYVQQRLLVVDEILDLQWRGIQLASLALNCPTGFDEKSSLRLSLEPAEGGAGQVLTWKATQRTSTGRIGQLMVNLPRRLGPETRLRIRTEIALPSELSEGQLAVPWILPRDDAVTPTEGSRLAVWTILPWLPETPSANGWTAASRVSAEAYRSPPQLLLSSRDSLTPPAIGLRTATSTTSATLEASRVLLELRPLGEAEWECRVRARLTNIRVGTARWLLDVQPTQVLITEVKVNGTRLEPPDYRLSAQPCCLEVALPPESLGAGALLEAKLRIQQPVEGLGGLCWLLPGLRLAPPALVNGVRLRVAGLSDRVFLSTPKELTREQHGHWGLGWEPAQPSLNGRALSAWVDPEGNGMDDPDTLERPAYSFAGQGQLGALAIWHAPRARAALICTLAILALGVLLIGVPPRHATWLLALLLGVALVVALALPQFAATVFMLGWPGVLAALLLGGWQWRRVRRQALQFRRAPTFLRAADVPRRQPEQTSPQSARGS